MTDLRLDTRLTRTCATDITSLCGSEGSEDAEEVTTCLQDFMEMIADPVCHSMVQKYQELAAEDIRFNTGLADACYEDRQRLCANVPPGSARVIRCLQGHRAKLSKKCGEVLFTEEVGELEI